MAGWGSVFRVEGLGFRDLGFQGLKLGVRGLGFRVEGLGLGFLCFFKIWF